MKNYVRELRRQKSITQNELALRMKVSRQTINAIETNRYLPSLTLALKLSDFFDLTVNEIFELDESAD